MQQLHAHWKPPKYARATDPSPISPCLHNSTIRITIFEVCACPARRKERHFHTALTAPTRFQHEALM